MKTLLEAKKGSANGVTLLLTSVNDLHATILHLLGLDDERLIYFHNDRSYRHTDVAGKVIQEILA